MLFAGDRKEVGQLLGLQEQNKICLQSDPPQCFDIGNPLDNSLNTGSPYQTPSRKDFEDEMKPGEGGPPADFDIKDFLAPVKKADASNFFNEGTGIEKEGFDSVPEWAQNRIRELQWKEDLKRRQELGLEPVAY
tara:strand:+ start:503 stop:904 length:402 start_codon:yes stop_codon:yes gene_type:complete